MIKNIKNLSCLGLLILFCCNSFCQNKENSSFGIGLGGNLSKIEIENTLIESNFKPGFNIQLFFIQEINKKFSAASMLDLSFNNYILKDSQNEILLKNTKFSIPISIEYQPLNNLPLGVGLGSGISFNKRLDLNPVLMNNLKITNYYLLSNIYYKIKLESIILRPQISYERTITNLTYRPEYAQKSTFNITLLIY